MQETATGMMPPKERKKYTLEYRLVLEMRVNIEGKLTRAQRGVWKIIYLDHYLPVCADHMMMVLDQRLSDNFFAMNSEGKRVYAKVSASSSNSCCNILHKPQISTLIS